MPFELQGGGFGNPRTLSHSGLQESKKCHKPQRHRELTGWCVSTHVPVARGLRGRIVGWGTAPWALAYPHPILEGLTTALLHKGSQHEGRCWEWTIPA